MILLFSMFVIKHYIADFLLQPVQMAEGKGDLKKLGGYLHAAIHGCLTLVILYPFGWALALKLAILDTVLHFIIDALRHRQANNMKLCHQQARFWYLHGLDQMLHYLTYCLIIFITIEDIL